ncbi:hypothetical protein ACFPL7_04425 [Dongia soli]|uniref:Secreted protein n=1 Tax=Dongia soli TaxID=600628 RepID=A0ABU5EHF0_9PROT|nr:hypothetical protein [Dongia soli]MDY0885796.1 hypothetical protein [Dongia soli]
MTDQPTMQVTFTRKIAVAFTAVGLLMSGVGVAARAQDDASSPGASSPGGASPSATSPGATNAGTVEGSGETESAGSANTASNAGDDWPCAQRLQPELSVGAMWSGPDPTEAADTWRKDSAVEAVVAQVAPRRMPQQEAVDALHRFAAGYDKDRAAVMTKVFAGLFETLNDERGAIIRGIRHFNQRQQKLADRIQAGMKILDGLDPASTDLKIAEQRQAVQEQVSWDSRIFDDREKLLPLVCDQPVVLERRLFALSKAVETEIKGQK